MFSNREIATMLAALRLWQKQGSNAAQSEHFHCVEPLFDEDVDALCEKINEGADVISLTLNAFDSNGGVSGRVAAELPIKQVVDIIDHAAQLVRVLQARRQTPLDVDLVCEELQEAIVTANLAPPETLPYITLRG